MKWERGKLKFGWTAAVFSGLLFTFLLGTRLGFVHKAPSGPTGIRKVAEKDIWMSIRHKGKKIGFSHRRLTREKGGYVLWETTFLRINTMGLVQDIHIKTQGDLKADLSLTSFTFELRSNLFKFRARGEVDDGLLTVFVDDKPITIPIDEHLYLPASLLDAAWISDLGPDQTRTFSIFDPSTMGQRPVHITLTGSETLDVMGRRLETRKVSIDFMGTSQSAWIDLDGNVVQETGIMGLSLKRVSEDEARRDLAASRDLTQTVSVPVNITIEDPDTLGLLRLKLSGIDTKRLFLNGGRQIFENGMLSISREHPADASVDSRAETAAYLKATPFIQSDHPRIKKIAAEIVTPGAPDRVRARRLVDWVYRHIEKRPVLSVPNALETLKNRVGDCNEHAVLLAALARAAGIPAQVEAGLVYMKGRFYYHAWNVLFLDSWITADSLMGQMPADVTHIRFVRGEPDKQIDLLGVIGKIKLHIMEQAAWQTP
jgi:hypothetical protein